MPWFEGGSGRGAAADPVGRGAGLVGRRPLAARQCRTARARRRDPVCGVASPSSCRGRVWFAGGLLVEHPCDRRSGDAWRDAGRSVVLRPVLRARDLHRQPHRRDRPRLDPGGASRAGRGGRRASRSAVSRRCGSSSCPQALRIGIPPLGNQYLNLIKNSSLGAAIGYYDLTLVAKTSVGNGSPAVPVFAVTMVVYILCRSSVSFFVNLANRRLALVER